MGQVRDHRQLAASAGATVFVAGAIVALVPQFSATSVALADIAAAPTVSITGKVSDYPLPGEFLKSGRAAVAPRVDVTVRPFDIMTDQVSTDDYALCVAEGGCTPQENASRALPGHPVTGVSHIDAEAYAAWYSARSGSDWRLPTDLEWAAAAAARFAGENGIAYDPDNPAVAWLSRYEAEAASKAGSDPLPQPLGSFGVNSNGLRDVAGNVWEWTSTCYRRATIGRDGAFESSISNCGVHVVEGRHRTYVSDFVSDAKAGGCAVGIPPDNLGFRLVREPDSLFGTLGRKLWRLLIG